jgi:hypothetical protein
MLANSLGVVPMLNLAGTLYLLSGVIAFLRVEAPLAGNASAARRVSAVEGMLIEELAAFVNGRRSIADLPDLAPEMDVVLETMALDGVEDERHVAEYVRFVLLPATAKAERAFDHGA